MKKNILKIFALILILSALFSFLACGNDNTNTTTEPTSNEELTGDGVTEETSEIPNETTNTAPTDDVTTSTDEPTTQAPVTPVNYTKEQLVKYYVDAVNKVKSSAASVAKVYENNTQYKDILDLGNFSWLSGVAAPLMSANLKENTTRTDYATRAEIVANFPPAKSTTCNATVDVIDTATCVDKGTYYEVTLKLNSNQENPDINPPIGGGKAGTMFSIIEEADITAAASAIAFEGIKNLYFDCSAVAQIDKESGNMTQLYTTVPTIMSFDKIKVLITATNISVGLQYETKWEITW